MPVNWWAYWSDSSQDMPWPWARLPQKIRHSVGLSRITDKLIPSIDWKKSFNRSSTQAWGSRDHLPWAVKIRTSRLNFSCWRTPSATVAVAGDTDCDPVVGLVACRPDRCRPRCHLSLPGVMEGDPTWWAPPSLHWIRLA